MRSDVVRGARDMKDTDLRLDGVRPVATAKRVTTRDFPQAVPPIMLQYTSRERGTRPLNTKSLRNFTRLRYNSDNTIRGIRTNMTALWLDAGERDTQY